MHLIHQESGKQVNLTDDPLIIAAEWLALMGKRLKGVEETHARIVKEGSGYRVEAIFGDTYYNGTLLKPGEGVTMVHNSVLHFGDRKKGAILIYKDFSQSQRLTDAQRLQSARLDLTSLKSTAELFGRKLFSEAPTSLIPFAEYFLKFLEEKFRVQRSVLYEVRDGSRWIPLRARAISTAFTPPKKILKQVWDERVPVRFDLPTAMETSEISQSIVDGNVQSAICFPLLREGVLVGVLYMDTQHKSVILSHDDLVVLCALMPAVSAYAYLLMCQERRKLTVDRELKSLAYSDAVEDGPTVRLFHKVIFCYSYVRTMQAKLIFYFVQVQNKNRDEMDFTVQIAAYSGIFSVINTFAGGSEDIKGVLGAIRSCFLGKFPTLDIAIGVVVLNLNTNALSYTGFGNTFLVIKPPNATSFGACGDDNYYAVDKEIKYSLVYDVEPGSFFILSGVPIERVCSLVDRITVERVLEDLRSFPGCIFCRVEDT